MIPWRTAALVALIVLVLARMSAADGSSPAGDSRDRAFVQSSSPPSYSSPMHILVTASLTGSPSLLASASLDLVVVGKSAQAIARAKQGGKGCTATIQHAIVTAGTAQLGLGCCYVQSVDAPVGIRVISKTVQLVPGDLVTIAGTILEWDGETMVWAAETQIILRGLRLPPPISMVMRDLGGARSGGAVGQAAVDGGAGLNNIGLQVRVCGRVTQIGSDYFYLDDGSALRDGTYTWSVPNAGVRIVCVGRPMVRRGQFVSATGICSCFITPTGGLARRILTRTPSDVSRPPGL